MRKLSNHRIGICDGDEMLFSDLDENGPMWSGNGPRKVRHAVRFAQRYRNAPSVQVSLSMIDIDHTTNTRLELRAEQITEWGFDIVFQTWSDTRIARARATWIAIGEVAHDDDWEID